MEVELAQLATLRQLHKNMQRSCAIDRTSWQPTQLAAHMRRHACGHKHANDGHGPSLNQFDRALHTTGERFLQRFLARRTAPRRSSATEITPTPGLIEAGSGPLWAFESWRPPGVLAHPGQILKKSHLNNFDYPSRLPLQFDAGGEIRAVVKRCGTSSRIGITDRQNRSDFISTSMWVPYSISVTQKNGTTLYSQKGAARQRSSFGPVHDVTAPSFRRKIHRQLPAAGKSSVGRKQLCLKIRFVRPPCTLERQRPVSDAGITIV